MISLRFDCVDPAHAGMIPVMILSQFEIFSGPRACGDDPDYVNAVKEYLEWTPRMRG